MTPKKQKQPRKISRQYLENAALYYLQRFASSEENLRRVLSRKVKRSCAFHKEPEEPFYPLIDDIIKRYAASGLLNDNAYAEARATSLRRQGHSQRGIEAKLQTKGLSRTAIAAALEKAGNGDEDELAAAIALARRRKLGPLRRKVDEGSAQKDLAALGRAGFSYEIARAALRALSEEE